MNGEDLLIVAGEASGDLHGARLLAELVKLRPGLRPFGLGGDELDALRFPGGRFEGVAHSREISVVGITEALRVLPRAWTIFRRLLDEVDRRGARTALLIDSPDFNLRLARKLARRGVKVLYYISPQLWAWRQGRLRTVRRYVERMLVVFPFEVEFYRCRGVEVTHVGHPLVDEVPELPQVWDEVASSPETGFTVALLPGSRSSEVRAHLPSLLEGVRELAAHVPLRARLIQAPTVPRELFDRLIEAAGVEVERVDGDRFAAIAGSHLALCASGTATVEVGLLGTPMIVVYRLTRWSYWLARLLVDLEHFSMVNLVLGRQAVPELLQDAMRPARLAAEARRLLEDRRAIAAQREALAELRPRLGSRGASRRAATAVAASLPTLTEEAA